ncbi:hypothetical protein [Streptomyces flaveolus]|uniref:hypothetical protein n=1 Tax=Streptomyces flaveolus TaxID=67297 RepID=UPI00367B227B
MDQHTRDGVDESSQGPQLFGELRSRFARLTAAADDLAGLLERTAAEVRAGIMPGLRVDEALRAFRTGFRELEEAVAAPGEPALPAGSATRSLSALGAALSRRVEAEAEAIRAEIADLTAQLEEARLDRSRVALSTLIAELRADLAHLEAVRGPVSADRRPAAATLPKPAGAPDDAAVAARPAEEEAETSSGVAEKAPDAGADAPLPEAGRPSEGDDDAPSRPGGKAPRPKEGHRRSPAALPPQLSGSYVLGGVPSELTRAPGISGSFASAPAAGAGRGTPAPGPAPAPAPAAPAAPEPDRLPVGRSAQGSADDTPRRPRNGAVRKRRTGAVEDTNTAEPEAADDEPHDRRPWQGDRTTRLVRAGRLDRAYWLTRCSDEPEGRAQALAYLAAAFATEQEPWQVQSVFESRLTGTGDGDLALPDGPACTTTLVAHLRCSLAQGWGTDLRRDLLQRVTLDEPWQEFAHKACEALGSGRPLFTTDEPGGADSALTRRAELGERAQALIEDFAVRSTPYPRATNVLHHLLDQKTVLGAGVRAVVDWGAPADGPECVEAIRKAAAGLAKPRQVDSVIEETDRRYRSSSQARKPIEAKALVALQDAVREVAALLRTAVTEIETAASQPARATPHAELFRLAGQIAAREPRCVEEAAFGLLADWIQRPSHESGGQDPVRPAESGSRTATEPDASWLLLAPELPRNADGGPAPADPAAYPALIRLLDSPPSAEEAFEAYAADGRLDLARKLLDAAPATLDPDDPLLPELAGRLQEQCALWNKKLGPRIEIAIADFETARRQNLTHADDERIRASLDALSSRYQALRASGAAVDYGALVRRAEELRRPSVDRITAHRAALEDRLDKTRLGREDKQRVRRLLERTDWATASELITEAEQKNRLPQERDLVAQDLRGFVELLNTDTSRMAKENADARYLARRASRRDRQSAEAEVALEAWERIHDRRPGAVRQRSTDLKSVLRLLGLNAHSVRTDQGASGLQGVLRYGVSCDMNRVASHVPEFGSGSGGVFQVLLATRPLIGQSPADLLTGQDQLRPTLLLCPQTFTPAQRFRIAGALAQHVTPTLVVDHAVIGWMAARAYGSFQRFQRVTLPWTRTNPYQDAGVVPREMFYGRTAEEATVLDPRGGMFLYGGRQLGKSALLRRIETEWQGRENEIAVYMDLRGLGIGESQGPDRIWQQLRTALDRHPGFARETARLGRNAGPEVIAHSIKNWLDADSVRRVLLLADEADPFLTADSNKVATRGGTSDFVVLRALRQLRDDTSGRFKPVFAGLHQVQRFGTMSNTPTVQGGVDVLIGPLDPDSARSLVVEPLAALGFVFGPSEEERNLVWRLLAATNYYPPLIQLVCRTLVTTLRQRLERTESHPPVLITEEDVEQVITARAVMDGLRDKLRITVNLEDRYRVLSLVTARMAIQDSYAATYPARTIHDEAAAVWEPGFPEHTEQVTAGYLREMVGLGILVEGPEGPEGHGYTMRSPNMVNLLWTVDDIERELKTAEFDAPYEYNPLQARRTLELETDGLRRFSPLTDGRIAVLTQGTGPVTVFGSPALGSARLVAALRSKLAADQVSAIRTRRGTAEDRAHDSTAQVDWVRPAELGEWITRNSAPGAENHKPSLLVVDLLGADEAECAEVEARLGRRELAERLRSVLLRSNRQDDLRSDTDQVVRMERWTVESLRAWPECVYDTPDQRSRLIAATGGWPELVEDVVARAASHSMQRTDACAWGRDRLTDPQLASAFIDAVGLTERQVEVLRDWVEYATLDDRSEGLPLTDVADLLAEHLAPEEGPPLEAAERLQRELSALQVLDPVKGGGLLLDSAVCTALHTLHTAGAGRAAG